MDDATPKEIMALGAMVERTLACKCRGDEVDDADIDVHDSKGYGRGLHWHKSNISWDDATLETTGMTEDQGLVEFDISARGESILSQGEEENEDDLEEEVPDMFVPFTETNKKTPFKFLPGKSHQKRIPKQQISSIPAMPTIPATVTPVADEDGQSGFEVEFRLFEI